MENHITIVGLDVHKDSISAAVLPARVDRMVEEYTIQNNPKALKKLVDAIAAKGPAEFVYEAGPCGYEPQRQIAALGHKCVLIAPSLIPVLPGDRVKTDRRDARKLAMFHRAGQLTEIRVPSRMEEAARDLPRAREDALEDRLRARHRLLKFLLRQGRVYRETRSWGKDHKAWLRSQRFEYEPLQQTYDANMRTHDETEARLEVLSRQIMDLAESPRYRTPVGYLKCLKGVDTLSALTLLLEAQDFRRFKSARDFMSFTGLVGSEYSSGSRIVRGGITRAGNAHLRRVLVECSWGQRYGSGSSAAVAERREGCPPEVLAIAKKAQARLHRKYIRMQRRGKLPQVTIIAVARELAGFVWAIGQKFPQEA